MLDVRASWAEFDTAAVQTGSQPLGGGRQQPGAMLVQVGFAEFDAATSVVSVQVGFAEFDALARQESVQVSWAEFDVVAVVQPRRQLPPYFSGGGAAQYYNDSLKQYIIPINADEGEEEEIILALLMEIATYVV